jgi:hypothetical protein
MTWRSLASQMAKGSKRGQVSQKRLTQAYLDVFANGSESAEIVLADLANFSGFYKVPPIGAPPETLLVDQGLRASFGRLFHFLSLPDDRLAALEKAARQESLADDEEGII